MHTRTLAILLLAPAALAAQNVRTPALEFSGVMFGNYQMRTDSAARAATGGEKPNRFDLGRVYLNFRMPAGDKGSIRITTDIFQQSGAAASYYAGWTIRLKYGYFQYNFTDSFAGVDGLGMLARVGMLHNVIVEHVDRHWPRFLGVDPLETHGFFASADVGAATLLTLPNEWGEAYLTVINGSNYTSGETDRFKDFAGRLSLTPFGRDSGILKNVSITPWYSVGKSASAFFNGGVGQVGPVTDGLQKDRRGIFLGVLDRKLTAGAEFSQRIEDVESGANTVANPRVVRNRTSDLYSAFAVVRPLEWINPAKRSPWSAFARLDEFELDETTDSGNKVRWFGLMYDINSRSTIAIDHQELLPRTGSVTVPARTWFIHWVAGF